MRKYKLFADGIGYQDGKARIVVGGNFYNTGLKEVQQLRAVCLKYIAKPERPALEKIFGQEYLTWLDFCDIILLFTAAQARSEEWGYAPCCSVDRELAVKWSSRRMRNHAPEFFREEIQRGVENAKVAAGWPVETFWAHIDTIKEG